MDITTRIEQFQKLIAEDPTSDMAYFSLGGALNQAGRYEEAAAAFLKTTELNPSFSKAYQMAGAASIAAGDHHAARDILRRGYITAAQRGDLMPKNAIADLLAKLAEPLPEVPGSPADHGVKPAAGDFLCRASGRPGTRLPRPPFKNPVGTWIYDNISKQTFDEWIGLGTKIINELRLDLSRDEHDAVYDHAMRRFLGLTDETYRSLMGKAPPEPADEYRRTIDTVLERSGQLEAFQGDLHKSVGS